MAELLANLGLEAADLWNYGAIGLAALVVVAVLLVIWRMLASRRTGVFVTGGRNRQVRLSVIDAAPVDEHRRLVLVRRDDVEHLLLIGGHTDIVVEPQIRRGPAVDSDAEHVRRKPVQAAEPAVAAPAAPPVPSHQPAAKRDDAPSPAPQRQQPRFAAPDVPPPPPVTAPVVPPQPAIAPTVAAPRIDAERASRATAPDRPVAQPAAAVIPPSPEPRAEAVRPAQPPMPARAPVAPPVSMSPQPAEQRPRPAPQPPAIEPAPRPVPAVTLEPPVRAMAPTMRPAARSAPVVDIADIDHDDMLGGAIEEIESALAGPVPRPGATRRTEPAFASDGFENLVRRESDVEPPKRQSDDLQALEDEMEQLLNNLANPARR